MAVVRAKPVVRDNPVVRSGGTELFLAGRSEAAPTPVVRAVTVVLPRAEAGVDSDRTLAAVEEIASRFDGDTVGPAESLLPSPVRDRADEVADAGGSANVLEGRLIVRPASAPNCLDAAVVVVVDGRAIADRADPSPAGCGSPATRVEGRVRPVPAAELDPAGGNRVVVAVVREESWDVVVPRTVGASLGCEADVVTVSEIDFERGWKLVRAGTVLVVVAEPVLGRAAVGPVARWATADVGTAEGRRAAAMGPRLVRFETADAPAIAGGAIDGREVAAILVAGARALGNSTVFTDALVVSGAAPAEREIRLEFARGGNMLCLCLATIGTGGGGIFAGVLRFVYGMSAAIATGFGSVSERLFDLRLDRRALSRM